MKIKWKCVSSPLPHQTWKTYFKIAAFLLTVITQLCFRPIGLGEGQLIYLIWRVSLYWICFYLDCFFSYCHRVLPHSLDCFSIYLHFQKWTGSEIKGGRIRPSQFHPGLRIIVSLPSSRPDFICAEGMHVSWFSRFLSFLVFSRPVYFEVRGTPFSWMHPLAHSVLELLIGNIALVFIEILWISF